MRRVYSSFNLQAAHHAKNVLQNEGIRATVRNEHLASAMGELPPAECQFEVWVLRDEDRARAEALLRQEPQGHGAVWRCPRCGEVSEPQFTQCWKCGAAAGD
jgi:putative signal transducing protein